MKIQEDREVKEEDTMEGSESKLRSILTPTAAVANAADPVSASFADLMGVDEDYYYDGTQYFYDDDDLKNVQLEAVNGAIGQAKANDKKEKGRTKVKGLRVSRLQQQQQRRSNFHHRRLGGGTGVSGVGATGLSGIEYTSPDDALSGGITGLSGGGGGAGATGIGGTGLSASGGGADAIGSRRMRGRRQNGVRRSSGFSGYGSGYGYGGGGGGAIERSSGYGGGHSGGGYGHSGGGGGHPIGTILKLR